MNAFKRKGVKTGDLTWSGAVSASVDIRRDGGFVTSVSSADGFYRDITGQKGGGSTTWQVCEAGTTDCATVIHSW